MIVNKIKSRYSRNKGMYVFVPFLVILSISCLVFGAYQKHRRDELCAKYDCEEIARKQHFINIIEEQYGR